MNYADLDLIESLEKDLNSINVWLQNIADIPPETKLTKDGTGFTLYPDTIKAWFIRTFWTSDSGNSHTTEFKSTYEKIELKLRECMNLSVPIDPDYYQNIASLLTKSKTGLSNFMNHHSYRQNTYITGNIQNLINFVIPKQIKLIKDYLQGETYMKTNAMRFHRIATTAPQQHHPMPFMTPTIIPRPSSNIMTPPIPIPQSPTPSLPFEHTPPQTIADPSRFLSSSPPSGTLS